MKPIIVYYSRSGENYVNGQIINIKEGNAKVIATNIHRVVGGTLYDVPGDRKYSINYQTCTEEASDDLRTSRRPKITSPDVDFSLFDTVFLVYPNWWGDMPVTLMSFLEHYDLKDKIIIPLCTHEGSALGHSVLTIKKLQPNATILHEFSIKGSKAANSLGDIQNWISRF